MPCISTQIFSGYSLWLHGYEALITCHIGDERHVWWYADSESETEVLNLAPTSSNFIRIEA
jgi:hypothetical protein